MQVFGLKLINGPQSEWLLVQWRRCTNALLTQMKSLNTLPNVTLQPVTGRVAQDERGNAVWEIKTESGRFRQDIDTQRALHALYSNELSANAEALSCNPYNSVGAQYLDKRPTERRRTLDDLRRLSEHIKQSKQWKK